jgi:hypothetical protein
MTKRSLHAVTKIYYKSMSCFAMVFWVDMRYHGSACSATIFRIDLRYHNPSCTMWVWVKSQTISHSSEQDTLHIVFLINKQAISYRTHGDTYYPGVSSPKIRFLADSSTTCHDGINHLHHSNHCSNHNIDPHMIKSYLDGWETTSLTLRHKPNSTS